MTGHVFTALRADVLEGDGRCGGKLGLLEAIHEELQHRVWKGGKHVRVNLRVMIWKQGKHVLNTYIWTVSILVKCVFCHSKAGCISCETTFSQEY